MKSFNDKELAVLTSALLDRLAMLHTTLQKDPQLQYMVQPKIDAADALLSKIDALLGV